MGKTWQVILATVAIFLAGLVTGGATALGVVWVVRHRAMNAGQGGGEALRKLSSRHAVYILPPIKVFKDYIFLFPNYSSGEFRNNEAIYYPHKNFIFYK